MVTTLMVMEPLTTQRQSPVEIHVVQRDPAEISVMQAWRWAVVQGKTTEASLLRRILDGYDDEPTQADAEWQ